MHHLLLNRPAGLERAKVFEEENAAAHAKTRFREQFKRSLRACLKRRGCVEECFGKIWQETLDEITLSDVEQAELFRELLEWARQWTR